MKLSLLRIINLAFIISIFVYDAMIYFMLGEKALRMEPLSVTVAVFIIISVVNVVLGVIISALLISRCREGAGEDTEAMQQCLIAPYLVRWAFFESGAVIGVAGVLTFREGFLIWVIPSLVSLIALAVDYIGTYGWEL